MNARSLALAAALVLSAGGASFAQPAFAQPAFAQSVPADVAGDFLYGPQGDTLGSVVRLTDGGRTAVLRIGFIREPGTHDVTVPASALSVVDGRVTLRAETMQALNVTTR